MILNTLLYKTPFAIRALPPNGGDSHESAQIVVERFIRTQTNISVNQQLVVHPHKKHGGKLIWQNISFPKVKF
jgi:hypothetical protein